MLGRTPPSAIVVLAISLFNSSSFLMARRMCLGLILFFLLSFAAFPASSRTFIIGILLKSLNTSAARYSRTAER
jgi:hypothetical protein